MYCTHAYCVQVGIHIEGLSTIFFITAPIFIYGLIYLIHLYTGLLNMNNYPKFLKLLLSCGCRTEILLINTYINAVKYLNCLKSKNTMEICLLSHKSEQIPTFLGCLLNFVQANCID